MRNLLEFLHRYRIFGFFLLLEGLAWWLITSYNSYYNAYFFNSSNRLAASISQATNNSVDYFELKEENTSLARENALLRQQIANLNALKINSDTSFSAFQVLPARVINSTHRRSANFLTLALGADQGVQPEMGVVGKNGVVGVVRSVSKNFATVTSLLHRDLMVSSQLKNTKTLCTVQWNSLSPIRSEVKFIPRHIPIAVGDTVETSGFNAVFPAGLVIGTLDDVDLPEESPFYSASISLATDFTSFDFVYVIRNKQRSERDSLEAQLPMPL
ncbi:MAG: rod shape-determining protein MreC [Cyclobacteriaceae bacterium]|nr:rod shape-determining protein MreC [Cyclobacteriaceae bacterium HetDA_MAG_MS6]